MPTSELGPTLIEPSLTSGPAASHSAFYFDRVISSFRDPPHKGPVPPITVPYFSENAGASLKFRFFGATNLSSPGVCCDDEVLDSLRHSPPRNIAEDAVELLGFCSAFLITTNSPIFTKNTEVEGLVDGV